MSSLGLDFDEGRGAGWFGLGMEMGMEFRDLGKVGTIPTAHRETLGSELEKRYRIQNECN